MTKPEDFILNNHIHDTWFTDAVNNVRFYSNRLWKSNPPDKFDYIYTRLLYHTGEIYKRVSETTVDDVLAGINLRPTGTECETSDEDREVRTILSPPSPDDDPDSPPSTPVRSRSRESLATEDTGRHSDEKDDILKRDDAMKLRDEWFAHPRVQSYVAQQVKVIDDNSDDFLRFEDSHYKTQKIDHKMKHIESAYWESTRTVGENPSNSPVHYNNSFDPRLRYKGVLLMQHPSFGKDPLVDCPGAPPQTDNNIFLGVGNASVITELHYSRYRSFLRGLSRKPMIKDSGLLLPADATPVEHATSVQKREVVAMEKDIPIDWHKLTPPEAYVMRRVLDDKVKHIWTPDHEDEEPHVVYRSSPGPGPIRRPSGSQPWVNQPVPCTDIAPEEVYIPAFLASSPQKNSASSPSSSFPTVAVTTTTTTCNKSRMSPTHSSNSSTPRSARSTRPFKIRLGDDSDLLKVVGGPFTGSSSNSPDPCSPIPSSLGRQRSYSNPDLTHFDDEEVEEANTSQTLNPLAMDYFPSFHSSPVTPKSTESTTKQSAFSACNFQTSKSYAASTNVNSQPQSPNVLGGLKYRQRPRPGILQELANDIANGTASFAGHSGKPVASSPVPSLWSGQGAQWVMKPPNSNGYPPSHANLTYSQLANQGRTTPGLDANMTNAGDKLANKAGHVVHPFVPAWPQQHHTQTHTPGYFKDALTHKNKLFERGISPPTSVARLFNDAVKQQVTHPQIFPPMRQQILRPQPLIPPPPPHKLTPNQQLEIKLKGTLYNQPYPWAKEIYPYSAAGMSTQNQPLESGHRQGVHNHSSHLDTTPHLHPLHQKALLQESLVGQNPMMPPVATAQPKPLNGTPSVAFNHFVQEFMAARNVVNQSLLQQQVQQQMQQQQQHFQQQLQQQLQLHCMQQQQQQQQQQQIPFQQSLIRHPQCQGTNRYTLETSNNFWAKPPSSGVNYWRHNQQATIRQENILKLTKQIQSQK